MIRQATLSDVAAMNRLRLQVRETALSYPGLVTEAMNSEAITALGRGWVFDGGGWKATGTNAKGEIQMELVHPRSRTGQ